MERDAHPKARRPVNPPAAEHAPDPNAQLQFSDRRASTTAQLRLAEAIGRKSEATAQRVSLGGSPSLAATSAGAPIQMEKDYFKFNAKNKGSVYVKARAAEKAGEWFKKCGDARTGIKPGQAAPLLAYLGDLLGQSEIVAAPAFTEAIDQAFLASPWKRKATDLKASAEISAGGGGAAEPARASAPAPGGKKGGEEGGGDEVSASLELADGVGFSYEDGEGSFSFPLFGQTITVGAEEFKASGEMEKQEFEADLPGLSYSFDCPLPLPVPAYATIGFELKPSLSFSVEGGYEIGKTPTEATFKVNGKLGGEAGVSLTVKGGVGIGVANVVGVDAGLFGEGTAKAELGGEIKGEVKRETLDAWKSSSLELKASAGAEISVAAGAYVELKAASIFSASRKLKFKDWKVAEWEFERTKTLSKEGLSVRDIAPTLDDVTPFWKDKSTQDIYSDEALLLGNKDKLRGDALKNIRTLKNQLATAQGQLEVLNSGAGSVGLMAPDKKIQEILVLQRKLGFQLAEYDANSNSEGPEGAEAVLIAEAIRLQAIEPD